MQFLFHKFDIIGIEKKLIGLFKRRVLDQTSLNAQREGKLTRTLEVSNYTFKARQH